MWLEISSRISGLLGLYLGELKIKMKSKCEKNFRTMNVTHLHSLLARAAQGKPSD